MSKKLASSNLRKFRFVDIFVVVFFVSTAFAGLYLFQQDLMQTFDARDVEPAGTITIRNNIIQRRHEDRVLWERIFVSSSVYPGDLIRAADLSSATIDIADNEIFLSENTLIRIQSAMGGMGTFQVELREGNISVASGAESSGIMLNLFGSYVQALSGSVLNATADEEGISIQVNEGTAEFIQEGQAREITEGSMIAFDTEGVEKALPAAIVTRPVPNARYLKNSAERLVINFEWTRTNLEPEENLRLEISSDFNFRRTLQAIDTAETSAQIGFNAGQWYWRLMYEGSVIRRGWVTVIDASGPALSSPATGTVFRYSDNPPQLRFQWAERQEVSRYLVEISNTQDFTVPVTRQVTSTSLIISDLGQGTWYWRVKPVFSSNYIGDSSYSQIASFTIERTNDKSAPAIVIPASSIERVRAINEQIARNSAAEAQAAIRPEPIVVVGAAGQPVNNIHSTNVHYTIRPGDTLGRIARQFYGDPMLWTRIIAANNIQNPDLIYPGQVFLIP